MKPVAGEWNRRQYEMQILESVFEANTFLEVAFASFCVVDRRFHHVSLQDLTEQPRKSKQALNLAFLIWGYQQSNKSHSIIGKAIM